MANLLDNVRWKRFWIPRETQPQLDGRGYFADPEAEYGKLHNPKAKTLEELDDRPCLALLGEPGIGKSHVVDEYRKGATARAGEGAVLYVDFRWPRDLNRAIFATSQFERWRKGEAALWLVLDSLDEYREGPAEAAAQIIGELQGGPVGSLRLRIACRTAEWPGVLDEQLPRLWRRTEEEAQQDEEPVAFYALAPLRRVDVAAAAKEDAAGFLEEVARRDAEPLAIKPITLRFLLEEYRRNQRLPPTRVELYEKGCTILCEEGSRSREAPGAREHCAPSSAWPSRHGSLP